jgi:MFS family permease
MVLFAISSGLFIFVDLNTSVFWIVAILIVRGIAMAFTFIPLQAAAFATISPADTGQASSIFNTGRQVAAAVGTAILATALTQRLEFHADDPAGFDHGALLAFHDAFFVGFILAVIGIFFALMINDRDAAPSMRGQVAVSSEA